MLAGAGDVATWGAREAFTVQTDPVPLAMESVTSLFSHVR